MQCGIDVAFCNTVFNVFLQILVPFASSPSPEISWKKDGKLIDEKLDRLSVESNDFLTQLSYEKCELGDTGTYSVKVSHLNKIFSGIHKILAFRSKL